MEKSKDSELKCKICKETEFTFHTNKEIYNPETDTYEDIKDINECNSCGALHFSTLLHDCVQTVMRSHKEFHSGLVI